MLPPTVAVRADRDDIDEYDEGDGSDETTPCIMAAALTPADDEEAVAGWKPSTPEDPAAVWPGAPSGIKHDADDDEDVDVVAAPNVGTMIG